MKEEIIAGIDEAGRGPVLGPMSIAGVSIRKADEKKLIEIGVKDSKDLTPKKREELAKKIEKIAKDIFVINVAPCRIDNYLLYQKLSLNEVEIIRFADIGDLLRSDKLYVDSPEVKTDKFANKLKAKMEYKNTEITAENKADSKYPVVSAASIIAKVARDAEMEKLRKEFGVRGSGYPSDEETISWMKEYLDKNGKFPEKGLVRFSWDTTKKMLAERKQSRLFGFFRK
ncbi:MAG: ribonuclease HII [Candidatus Aenigmarchaeota archaeon]|nr:ribonuclease HII [Candidatus Aenigmarchaeota archaeon]